MEIKLNQQDVYDAFELSVEGALHRLVNYYNFDIFYNEKLFKERILNHKKWSKTWEQSLLEALELGLQLWLTKVSDDKDEEDEVVGVVKLDELMTRANAYANNHHLDYFNVATGNASEVMNTKFVFYLFNYND